MLKRRNSTGIRRNSSSPIDEAGVLISPEVDKPSSPTPPLLTRSIPHVELTTVFKTLKEDPIFFEDTTFTTADREKSIASFVGIKEGRLQMSNCFREALDVLAHVTGGRGQMYAAVVKELQLLEQGEPHSELTLLQSFIDYQVYKVGEHDRTHDEVNWTNKIATDVMVKVPQLKALLDQIVPDPRKDLEDAVKKRDTKAIQNIIGGDLIDNDTLEQAQLPEDGKPTTTYNKLLQQAALFAAIKSEVGKHYMCRMRYTKPIPGLVARNTPGFIQERLRFQEITDPIYVFETSNGVTIAYDSTRFTAEQAQAHFNVSGTKKLELTPFNPKEMMLATMQVPVMSEPITLNLQVGHPARSLSVTIGKRPEDMGYQMTDEPAGVFRRSLNSQRVTEIKWVDDKNLPVCFQMKGAGVPAYGFDMANAGNLGMGEFTGSEFFKLNAETGSIGLRSFAISAFGDEQTAPQTLDIALAAGPTIPFGIDRIAPQTLGMAQAADKGSAYSSGTRNGAISFRADYSSGVRLENVLMAGEGEQGTMTMKQPQSLPQPKQQPSQPTKKMNAAIMATMANLQNLPMAQVRMARIPELTDPTIIAMRARVGLNDSEKMKVFKEKILRTMARNLAITHLFGMEYDDSSLKDLSDVGLEGEFSDSGTLRNHELNVPFLVANTALVNIGVRAMLGPGAFQKFLSLYAEEMVKLLKDLAGRLKGPANERLPELIKRVENILSDSKDGELFLQLLPARLGGPSSQPTPVQQAFYNKGIEGYAQVLCDVLQGLIEQLRPAK